MGSRLLGGVAPLRSRRSLRSATPPNSNPRIHLKHSAFLSRQPRPPHQIVVNPVPNQAPSIGSLSDSPDPVTLGLNLTLTANSVVDSDGTVVLLRKIDIA